jgi:hypothetical protein
MALHHGLEITVADNSLEARAWIACGATFGGDCFVSHHDALGFVDALYAAGALRVEVHDGTLVATLPDDPGARSRLFAMYNSEVDRFGEEFGGEETAGHVMTLDEASAIGHPDAEGEWVADDLHVTDTGQSTLTFWWD